MADFDSEFFIDYSSLDDFQRQLIDRKNNKSMVVSGCAGSGKSLIALHKAKQIAALGESYTIIVYTKSLRKYFEDGLKKLGLRNVYHYHQWRHNQKSVKYLIVDECQDFTREEINEMKQYGSIVCSLAIRLNLLWALAIEDKPNPLNARLRIWKLPPILYISTTD